MKRIILISGPQGSGKTTLSDLLRQIAIKEDMVPRAIKFADPLYELHKVCLPVLWDNGIRPREMNKDGELLQILGTEYGRKCIGEDVWVRVARRKADAWLEISPQNIVVIDDCRFENEFDAFPDAFKIRLSATEENRKKRVSYWRENTKHPSETGLDEYLRMGKFDRTLCTDLGATPDVTAVAAWHSFKNGAT